MKWEVDGNSGVMFHAQLKVDDKKNKGTDGKVLWKDVRVKELKD